MIAVLIGAFLLFIGFLETAPRPKRRFYDDLSGSQPAGFLMMLLGGLLVAFGTAAICVDALVAIGLAEADDPPFGGVLLAAGAGGGWLWLYDRQQLRRPAPSSQWARVIAALGKMGKRMGPLVFAVGVILTIAI